MPDNKTEDGLPILKKATVDKTEDGLPILKKKALEVSPLPSQSGAEIEQNLQPQLEGGILGSATTVSESPASTVNTQGSTTTPETPFETKEPNLITGESKEIKNISKIPEPLPYKQFSKDAARIKYDQAQAEKALKHDKGGITDRFLAGANHLYANIAEAPAMLWNTAAAVTDPLAHALGAEGTGAVKQENAISKHFKDAEQYINDVKPKEHGKGSLEYLKEGKLADTFSALGDEVAESLPASFGLMMGGAAGAGMKGTAAVGSLVFGADKQAQLDADPKTKDLPEAQKKAIALTNGFAEVLFEGNLGISKLGAITKKIFEKSGKEAAEKFAKEGFEKIYAPAIKQWVGIGAENMVQEAGTQFTQNVIDKYWGVDPKKDLTEGVAQAALQGLGAHAMTTTAPTLLDVARTKSAADKAHKIIDAKTAIKIDLASENVAPETKVALHDKLRKLNEEESDLHTEETQKHEALPEDKKKEVDDLLQQAHKWSSGLLDPSISESTREVIKKELDGVEKQVEKVYEENKPTEKAQETPKTKVDENVPSDFEKSFIESLKPKEAAQETPVSTETATETLSQEPVAEQPLPTQEVKAKVVGSGVGGDVKSDAAIEKRMLEIQDTNPEFDSPEQKEFDALEKEMEKRERISVFNVPLEKVSDSVDALMKKEKEQPNGYGSFIEKRDARETKAIADKYLNAKDISDAELKKDFEDAINGNPDTWYADGLKLRESLNEATKRGIDSKELISGLEKEYIRDGYSAKDAQETVKRKLASIVKKELSDAEAEKIHQTEIHGSEVKADVTADAKQEEVKSKPKADEKVTNGPSKHSAEKVSDQNTETKPVKTKQTQELIDEEEQIEAKHKDDPDSVRKLNDDIAILKTFNDKDVSSKKFKKIIERAFKMKDEGKISKPTYTRYRNIASQVLGPKINLDAEKAKFHVEQMKEEVKKTLLGEGYKKVIMSAPGFGPKQVADLIDLTAKLANHAIDAGFTVKEAVQKALDHIKTHPDYNKLIEGGHLDEKGFSKTVKSSFEETEKPAKAGEAKVEEKKRKSIKSLSKHLLDSEHLKEEAKDIIKEQGLDRDVFSQDEAKKEARTVIDKVGHSVALSLAKDKNIEMAGNVRTFLFGHILNDWNKAESEAKTPEEKERLADMQADIALDIEDVLIEFEKHSTEAGRLIGAIGEFYKMSPLGMQKKLTKEIDRVNDKKKKKMRSETKAFSNLKDDLAAISKKPKKESTEVEDFKDKKQAIKDKRKELLTKLKNSFSELGFAATPEKIADKQIEQTKLLGAIAKTYLDEGIVNTKEFIKNLKKDLREFGYKLTSEDEKILMNHEIDGKKLSEHLVNDVDPKTKEQQFKAVEKALKAKPKSLFGTKQTSKKETEQLLDLYNSGATESEFEKAFYEKFGLLNTDSEEVKEKLKDFSKKIADAPEGVLKNVEQTKYLNWLQEARNKSYVEAGMSAWYANILSSYETHLRNIQFNGITSVVTMPALLAQKAFAKGNIKEGLSYFGEFFTSFGEAHREATAVLKGGQSRFEDVSPSNALERSNNKILKAFVLPSRFLRAEDAASTISLYNAKQREIFNRIVDIKAKEEGKTLSAKEKEKIVNDLMGNTESRVNAANDQADKDVEKVFGENWRSDKKAVLYQKIRAHEIIEQSRPMEVRQEARAWAKTALLTNKPEGVSGVISDGLTHFLNHIPVIRLVTPFVNVPLNLMNQAIQRSPLGFIKVIRGKIWFDKEIGGKNYGRDLTEDERKELLFKATNYTIALAATTAVVAAAGGFGDDDDNASFVVTGKEGDYNRNQAIQKGGGMEPYSLYIGGKNGLRIGYQNTPLEAFLSPVGYFRDHIKYGETDKTVVEGVKHSFFQYIMGTLDKASMKGLKEILKYADPDELKRMADEGWSKEIAKKINTMFPYSGLVKATTNDVKGLMAADDKRADGFIDNLTAGLPFDYYQNDKIDIFGRPIKEQFNVPLLPVPSKKNFTPEAEAGLPKTKEPADDMYKVLIDHSYDPTTKFIKNKNAYTDELGEFTMTKQQVYELNKLRGEIVQDILNQPGEEGTLWDKMKEMDNPTFAQYMDKALQTAKDMAIIQKFVLNGDLPGNQTIKEVYDDYKGAIKKDKNPDKEKIEVLEP